VTRQRYYGGDAGVASVLACLALTGLIVMTSVVAYVGVAAAARHRVQAAADLAALAAAGALVEGAEAGCAGADALVRRMNSRMRDCDVAGWDVLVTVEQEMPLGPFGVRSVRAVARAGPVGETQ